MVRPACPALEHTGARGHQQKLLFRFDREKGRAHGVPQQAANSTLLMAMGNLDLYQVHRSETEEPVFMRFALQPEARLRDEAVLSLLVPSLEGDKVPLRDLMEVTQTTTAPPLSHKDLRPLEYVTAEIVGEEESPIYPILRMKDRLAPLETRFTNDPDLGVGPQPMLKWDGEMDITIEVFRDLGIAFGIALLLILVLVVGWYNSFVLPWIILVPIPLSLMGILPGHWALGAYFTATSMIGFIAGAGITVRNSILLVDFIELKRAAGR